MKPKVAIVGANGVYARHLLPRLAAAGYPVRALVRRPEAARAARACGAEIRLADIFDLDGLIAALEGSEICINLATSLPGPSGRGDFDSNDRLRREGTPILVEACRQAGARRLLQQSIAMVGAAGERLADEGSVFRPSDEDVAARAVGAALAMEQAVKDSELDWLILRGGLFYGPGTGFDDDWFSRAAAGKLRLPGDGAQFVTLLHIADMAAATMAALKVWPARETLIVADDEPVRWRELFGHIAMLVGVEPPDPGGRLGMPSFRMSNRRAREILDWGPIYSNYRIGLAR